MGDCTLTSESVQGVQQWPGPETGCMGNWNAPGTAKTGTCLWHMLLEPELVHGSQLEHAKGKNFFKKEFWKFDEF